MSKPKFKPGDRVRYTKEVRERHSNDPDFANRIMVVVGRALHTDKGVRYRVEKSRQSLRGDGSHGWDLNRCLELVPSKFKLDVDLTFDDVDQAVAVAQVLGTKLGKPIPIITA